MLWHKGVHITHTLKKMRHFVFTLRLREASNAHVKWMSNQPPVYNCMAHYLARWVQQ
jgi:hypothetical protein